MQHKKTVLLSVVGTSPAVLTETIWALYQEKPEYLPDEVIALSTTEGIDKLKKAMETPTTGGNTVWSDLKRAVGREKMRKDVRVFKDPDKEQELTDIITSHDQELVADLLLKEVRALKNPMLEECRIVASIAGGRKSMSALMYAVMSLAGDSGDIITHVLAPEVVTKCPDFFYPGQVKQYLVNRDGEPITAKEVQVELAQIPFVPLRSLVGEKQLGKAAGSFETLVKRARKELDFVKPEGISIRLSTKETVALINGEPLRLQPDTYLMLSLMVRQRIQIAEKGRQPKSLTYKQCYKMLELLLKENLIPISLQKRMNTPSSISISSVPVAKEDHRNAMKDVEHREYKQLYNDLAHNKQELKESAPMPASITKEKFNLKKALIDAGFSAIAEDALVGKRFGFVKISDVGFDRE